MDLLKGSLLNYALILLFAVISFAISLFLYKNSDLKSFKKAVLISLRSVSLFLILLLLLNPFFNLTQSFSSNPSNVILLDKSLSLKIENRDSIVLKEAKDLNMFSPKYFSFASSLFDEIKGLSIDTLQDYRYSSNGATTLENLSKRSIGDINSIIFISDGNFNEGNNFLNIAKSFDKPVHYILVGDTAQKNDILIKNISYNRISFVSSIVKINVEINSFGYDKIAKVNLYENGNKISTKEITVLKDIYDYNVSFDVSSEFPTINKYQIEIENLDNEITYKNNSETLFIKYLDNKIRSAVFCGSPSTDVSTFKRAGDKSNNLEFEYFIQKSANEFYDNKSLNLSAFNAIIFLGFPISQTSNELIEKIKTDIEKYSLPLIFINSSATDFNKLKAFEKNLPFFINNANGQEYLSSVKILTDRTNNIFQSLKKINLFPPANFNQGIIIPKPSSITLGLTSKESEPAIISNNQTGLNSSAFLGYNFYKWSLNPINSNLQALSDLQTILLTQIIDLNSKNKFSIITNKDYYAISEPIEIIAIDKTNNFNSAVSISANNKNLSVEKSTQNTFSSSFQNYNSEDISIKGELKSNDSGILSDKIMISTGESKLEYKVTKANEDILKLIALNTNGKNLKSVDKTELENLLNNKDKSYTSQSKKILLRNSLILLLLIIALLSTEWYLRRRFNLP